MYTHLTSRYWFFHPQSKTKLGIVKRENALFFPFNINRLYRAYSNKIFSVYFLKNQHFQVSAIYTHST